MFERTPTKELDPTSSRPARARAVVAEHVAVTTDGSVAAGRAFPVALEAIRACGSTRVSVLRVLNTQAGPPAPQVHALEWAMFRAQARAELEHVTALLDPQRTHAQPVISEGRPAEQILHFIDHEGVDLVVIASHGQGDSRSWRLGSTAHKIVASGHTSVLVVPVETEVEQFKTVVLPLDTSPRAECVLPLAVRLAREHDAELVLLHVVPEPEMPHRLPMGPRDRELVAELTTRNKEHSMQYLRGVQERLARQDVRCRTEILSNTNPARGIERFLEQAPADLLLLCAHGGDCNESDVYGSVPKRLLGSLRTPLWIVQDLPRSGSRGARGLGEPVDFV